MGSYDRRVKTLSFFIKPSLILLYYIILIYYSNINIQKYKTHVLTKKLRTKTSNIVVIEFWPKFEPLATLCVVRIPKMSLF